MTFPTPSNINYLWTFGGILVFFLGVLLVTGIVMAMHYAANTREAFDTIEKLMRDTNYGWLMRYTHAAGGTGFFVAAYIHIFRNLYYGSYKAPREVLWMIGVLIFLFMIMTAFMGYSLVWGQMSFWAVTVITSLFSSLRLPSSRASARRWWNGFGAASRLITPRSTDCSACTIWCPSCLWASLGCTFGPCTYRATTTRPASR